MTKYLSVCSGIEAATVAWEPLQWQPVGFSEIEPFPSAVLAHHYPTVPNFGDMTRFQEWPDDLAPNVLVGGTPCQSFSVAGLRKGLLDPRGNLALVYLALADRYRPEWLVWENVPGVLSSAGGRDFGAFLGALVKLGYGFAYRVLDAQYFGVAQRRRRVFVVANARSWRRAAAVLFERDCLQGHPAPRREQGQSLAPTITSRPAGSGGLGTDVDLNGRLIAETVATIDASFGRLQGASGQDLRHGHSHLLAFGGNNTSGPIDIATAVNASGSASGRQDFESETFIAHTLRGDGFDASEDGTGRGTPLVPVTRPIAFDSKASGRNGFAVGDISPTLRAMGHSNSHSNAGGQVAVAFDTTQITNPDNRSNPKEGDPCHPLAAGAHPPAIAISGRARGDDGRGYARPEHISVDVAGTVDTVKPDAVVSGMSVRRLTPRECERLQGFMDDYTRIPWRTYQEAARKGVSYESLLADRGMRLREPAGEKCPDGPRYKALGNSMAVPVMAWIGRRIQLVNDGWDAA